MEEKVDEIKYCYLDKLPDNFRVKLQPENSDELEKMYDFLFDVVGAGWAGRFGHYAYGEDHQIAEGQDGFIYCFLAWAGRPMITADAGFVDRRTDWPLVIY